jgi:hypothetical protein
VNTFVENKYTKIYLQLIEKRRNVIVTDEYSEIHHIIPKSLGGSNKSSNLVKLTAREHFIAHMLLIRITQDKQQTKMRFAIFRMMSNTHNKLKNNSRYYEIARKENAIALKNKIVTPETRHKMSVWQKGKPKTDETKLKLSIFAKTRTGAKNSFYGKHHTQESIEKSRISKLGHFYITNGLIDKKVKTDNEIKEGWRKGRSNGGRKTSRINCD